MATIYSIPFHVTRMPRSIMPADFAGAFVRCYAGGGLPEVAFQRMLDKLVKDGLHPKEILDPIHTMDTSDWSGHVLETWPEYPYALPDQFDFENEIFGGGVVYGLFGSYS